jgi:hypothetical protein
MHFDSPMNFKPQEKKPMSPEEIARQDYQPVSSSGFEDLGADSQIEYVPVSEAEQAPDTMRDEGSAPFTQWSEDLISGVRAKTDESSSASSDQMERVGGIGGAPVAYEMEVSGTIKTEGDRNLPPYTASSLDPDAKEGDGREAA